ncbi:MAG: hypothetical protein PW792_17050 [Acidobacteriaceae bacterium]|nr:hypothetical protein [Acidobacteriaceae bacterium]
MTKGAKVALASVAALILAVGIEVTYIKHKRAVEANEPTASTQPQYGASRKLTADDDVYLRKLRPDSLKDARSLIGKTVWVSAGDQLDYYVDTGNHVDYSKPAGVLKGAEPLEIKAVFEEKAPDSGRAVQRISAGERHVLFAFTMPKGENPKQLYAVATGHYEGGIYEFINDEVFFYDDPHTLYKHWSADAWAHVDKHECAVGMSENQCMLALGQTIDPHGDTMGDRSVTYQNGGHPVTADFVNGKAVKVSKDS